MADYVDVNHCPVCKSADFSTAFKKVIYKGKRCNNCGLIYISPITADVNEIYTNDISSSPSGYYRLSEKYDNMTFEKRLRLIELYSEKGKFLDIGCSTGNFLGVAEKNGWDAAGIEPNPESARICIERNFKVEQDFLTENISAKYKENFDAIYMGDVIEHVTDPLNLIILAMNMLKPRGVLMIVTPDFDSLVARKLQIKPIEHILYFNKHSLKFAADLLHLKTELIKKTTRKRSLKALSLSTTFSGKPFQKKILNVLSALYFNPLINLTLELFVRDELLIIIRK
jgi:2-polyprenyl-3-methyl-5-hydroxy-6-metoxy-1,4-benzoquinol methylase